MKKLLLIIIIPISIILFSLIFIEERKDNNYKDEEVIKYSVGNINLSLDKVTNLTKRDEDLICATSIGLVQLTEDDKICNVLANNIEINDNGIEYVFEISDKYYWSDGRRITPEHIKKYLLQLLRYEDEENIKAILNIYGAKQYREVSSLSENNVAISVDNNKLKIRLNTVDQLFVNELAKPQYRLREDLNLWQNINTNYNKISYSGYYYFEQYSADNIILIRNNNIENKGIPKISIIKDNNNESAMAAFEVGKRDIILDPPSSQLNRLNQKEKLITCDSNDGLYLIFNKESLTLDERRYSYKEINNLIQKYKDDNNQEVEMSEGIFFRDERSDLDKIQQRKVIINQEVTLETKPNIYILAINTERNREICNYLSENNNKRLNIKCTLVSKEEFENKELRDRYNVLMVNENNTVNDKTQFFNDIFQYIAEEEAKDIANIMNENGGVMLAEQRLFDSFNVLPILYWNKNIAISDQISNIAIDKNGNIDFSQIK